MHSQPHHPLEALRVRQCIPMAEEVPAVKEQLFAPLAAIDDALVLMQAGVIHYVGPYRAKEVPVGVELQDLGERTLVPCAVNAHTHLQLSHLAGKTLWGQGFVPWLASLIPHLSIPLDEAAVGAAVKSMLDCGTVHVADYTSHGMAMVGKAAVSQGLGCTLLAEFLGYGDAPFSFPWPERCAPVLGKVPPVLWDSAAPCGHALYSTAPELLQAVKGWCASKKRPFSLHLAEFPEEDDALLYGNGALVDLYRGKVLPEGWQPPGHRPVPLALQLGLLDSHTLAVHCVHCDAEDRAILAAQRVNVCLCPRSNQNLAVGTAPVKALAEAGVLLCLGTDGLSSNTDLNVWNEALHLRTYADIPWEALLRMLVVNGAAALGLGQSSALQKGRAANFAFLPQ